jgi:hypothetical protein
LVNLGYTDVVRTADGTYVRTLDQAGDPTAFMSFPDVDWAKVPGDIFSLLVKGIEKEFFSGNPTPGTPNAITGVFKLLSTILGGGSLGGFGDVLNAVMKGLNPLNAMTAASPLAVASAGDAKAAPAAAGPAPANSSTGSGAAPIVLDDKAIPQRVTEADEGDAISASAEDPASKPGPIGSVVGGVTDTVGGVTNTVGGVVGGVTSTVGGVTGGVTNTVGGVTGGLTNTVGGVTGGLTNTVGGLLGGKPKAESSSSAGSDASKDAA